MSDRGEAPSPGGAMTRIKVLSAHNLSELVDDVNDVLEACDGEGTATVTIHRDASDYQATIMIRTDSIALLIELDLADAPEGPAPVT